MPPSSPLVGQQPCGDGGSPGSALLIGRVGSRCYGRTSSRQTGGPLEPRAWPPRQQAGSVAPAPDQRHAKPVPCIAPVSGPWLDLAPCSTGHARRLRSELVPASGAEAARQAGALPDPSSAWSDPCVGGSARLAQRRIQTLETSAWHPAAGRCSHAEAVAAGPRRCAPAPPHRVTSDGQWHAPCHGASVPVGEHPRRTSSAPNCPALCHPRSTPAAPAEHALHEIRSCPARAPRPT